MAANINRFGPELKALIQKGKLLEMAMVRVVVGEEGFVQSSKEAMGEEKAENYIKSIPTFNSHYERWYSEAKSLILQLMPQRLSDFVRYYEIPSNRKDINHTTYVIQDYLLGTTVRWAGDIIAEPKSAIPKYRQQLYILEAVQARFESSLFEIKQLVQADLFDSEIDSARELLRKKFLRAAGAVAGVVLEKHLVQVCRDHAVAIVKKNPTISDLNEALKSSGVIDIPQWRYISMLADVRNLCDHNKSSEPTQEQVKDLVDGTSKTLKTVA